MKKALFLPVQLSNSDDRARLSGCYNDVEKWKEFLKLKNFDQIDERRELDLQESVKMIIRFLKNLSSGDLGVLFFAGHGTSYRVLREGQVEAFVCTRNYLIDSKLCSLFKEHLVKEAKLIFISDTCHSGGFFQILGKQNRVYDDIKYVSRYYKLEEMSSVKSFFTRTFSVIKSVLTKNNPCQMENVIWLAACSKNSSAFERNYDNGKVNGVFSYHCTKILMRNSNISYKDLIIRARLAMSSESERQVPQINSVNTDFMNEIVFT